MAECLSWHQPACPGDTAMPRLVLVSASAGFGKTTLIAQ
jgi:ATP-dependent exoDNAse (exonuclease V) beta subunit